MSLDLDRMPAEARDEILRLRLLGQSMEAYVRLLEGALLAAWRASEAQRAELDARPEAGLDQAGRNLRAAWELVGEVVLRVPREP